MSRVGQLLIAHPNVPEDNWFHQTVIYIHEDNDRIGSVGLTINVPTTATVKALLNAKGILYHEGVSQVFKGGPVNESAIILLHTDEWESHNTTTAGQGYRISSDDHMMEKISSGDAPAYWRMFVGLCGWAPGQLDMELQGIFPYTASNSWLTCRANDDILFLTEPEEVWEKSVEMASNQMFNSYFC